jgi:hypothetical protein
MDNSGGTGVVLVQFLIDGAVAGQTAKTSYSIEFNTATLMNGDHAFSAKAWDGAGNSAVSAMIMAHTTNAMQVAPDGGSGSGGRNGLPGTGGSGGTVSGGGATGGSRAAGGIVASGGLASGGRNSIDGGTDSSRGSASSGCGCTVAQRGTGESSAWCLLALWAVGSRRNRRRALIEPATPFKQ